MKCEECGSDKVIEKYTEEKCISSWSDKTVRVTHYRCPMCGHWMSENHD